MCIAEDLGVELQTSELRYGETAYRDWVAVVKNMKTVMFQKGGNLPLTLARIRCFATFGRTGGGGGAIPLRVSKRSIVDLSGKDQQIALAEYSRLVVLFLVLGQHLTRLWQVKGQIFAYSMIFQLYESISAKLSIVTA